ncbi:photosystem I subunit III (plastid) [Chondrus crispus]|uniref:Photosystem I reaction center subunit III n=1 Tax=Chondrus crispus TaxID=2769 RepID=M5DEQ3_CHOCR|nr:photosystem I subunit III [Chondrus crispus]CCP38041.1 photosystem I subunit III [Chondrus crispus]|eukprot:YP_007627294.1 photosystem I subunit III (plastid) [Chondrus crispus]
MNRKKILALLCTLLLCVSINTQQSLADIAGLTPCKDSTAFSKRLKNSVNKLENRLAKYDASTPPALALKEQINKTKIRFNKYSKSGVLCGTDGLPHLITDGRWNHAGEFVFPGLLFIYITGWIGWVGRGYLQAISKTKKPTEKEIIVDVPLALKFSVSGFTWPLAAIQEFTSGQLLANNEDITISPR